MVKASYLVLCVICLFLAGCNKYRFWNLKKLGEISTPQFTDNNIQSFNIKATLLDDGHSSIKRTGFVWSDINYNPTLQDNHIECTPSNNFINTLISWPVNTILYVRAYIENSIGISYSKSIVLWWPGNVSNLPKVKTINPNQVGFFELSINGEILSDGGLPLTEQGFCYSSSNQSPTTLDSVVVNTSGNSNYSELLTNLNENTTYYLRSFAKNLQGIAYGNMVPITTNNYYYPGESGNYGGLIFYSKIDTLGGWNFLEAAAYDVSDMLPWSFNNTSINTSNILGAGKQNTLSILQQLGIANSPYASLAAYYFPNGYQGGWSLPSRDELIKMRENLYLNQLGGFSAEVTYWSSSQDAGFPNNAWTVKMTNNNISNTITYAKSSQYKIRAIRRY